MGSSNGRVTGTVKRFSMEHGNGHAIPDGGAPDAFIHYKHLGPDTANCKGRKYLLPGERIDFIPIEREQGTLATDIRLLEASASRVRATE